MVNAILNGCNGAMGRVITDIVSKDDGIRIVAGVDVNPLKLADSEAHEIPGPVSGGRCGHRFFFCEGHGRRCGLL